MVTFCVCQHQEIVITPGANVKLINKNDDDKAGVTICDRGCKINETKSVINAQCESKSVDPTAPKSIKPTPSNETIEIKENDNDNVSLIAGIFSGPMVVLCPHHHRNSCWNFYLPAEEQRDKVSEEGAPGQHG